MKPISCMITGLLVAALASFGYSQSLAELAKKEKERREAVKGEIKVITPEQAAKYQTSPVTTTTPSPGAAAEKPGTEKTAAGAEKPAEAATAAKDKPVSDEPVDFQGRPESFWKQTFADARQKVKDLENESNVIILKLNDLQNRFYREDSGYKQQEIQREIQKTIYEQDVNKEKLTQAKDALVDLEKEARKSGALPGWIR
jgi:hypothetical protein